jgi:predicted CXXCH cytochrome family protein
MMKPLRRFLAFFFALWIGTSFALGQQHNPDGRKVSLDCVTCHASWHDNIDATKSLLPKIDAPIQIQGMPAYIPTASMCFTCHDGTVMDSRQIFSSKNHQKNMNVKHANIKDLPLDKHGDIYCGTCHTPHSLKPDRPGGLAPFLRKDKMNSDLCLSCHANQAQNHKNHPIKVQAAANNSMPKSTFWGRDGSMECMTCHPIHGKEPVNGVVGKDRSKLCASCHEAYFKIKLTDHDLASSFKSKAGNMGPDFSGNDPCAACHASHDGKAKHMWTMEIDPNAGENAYCLGCHSDNGLGKQKTFTHAGHPVSNVKLSKNIPELGIKAGDKLLCKSCHDPHQWEFSQKHAVDANNEEGTEYTSFLRLPDDAQGQLCVACHSSQSSMFKSDHSVAREGFQQLFRASNSLRGQCTVCHGAHTDALKGSKDDNPYIVLCMRCHDGQHFATSVVHNNHPIGVPFNSKSKLSGYNKDGQTLLSCNTCHDPHKWGKTIETSRTADLNGDDRNSFLTISNWPEPNLCLDCHPEQGTILNSDHDLPSEGKSACGQCHAPHNAETEYGILAKWGDAPGASFNEKHCFSCHNEQGVASTKLVEGYSHPREFGILAPPARGTGDWLVFPLFTEAGPTKTVGHIDCFTCHNPHSWSYKADLQKQSGNNPEGNDLSSFLRNPSQLTLCKDCHGESTLWKYNYYHDPVKRKRY